VGGPDLSTQWTEEADDVVVLRRNAVDSGVVVEAGGAERVTAWQSLGPAVRQLADPAHHQLPAALLRRRRRVAIRHRPSSHCQPRRRYLNFKHADSK